MNEPMKHQPIKQFIDNEIKVFYRSKGRMEKKKEDNTMSQIGRNFMTNFHMIYS